jgi:hypothetical protein
MSNNFKYLGEREPHVFKVKQVISIISANENLMFSKSSKGFQVLFQAGEIPLSCYTFLGIRDSCNYIRAY